MAIFPCVSLGLPSTVMILDELMLRLQKLVCRHESLKSLVIERSKLSAFHASVLQRMLESNSLHGLMLDDTTFSDDSICFELLIDGLESVQRTKGKLTDFVLCDLDVMKNPSFQAEQCRLFRSLGGLPNLEYLNMTLTCDSGEIPRAFGKEVLLHPECRIENLELTWVKEGKRGENNGDVDEIGARFDDFFSAFQQNTSVSVITFNFIYDNDMDCPDSIIKHLFSMALSPRKHCWHIDITHDRALVAFKITNLSEFVSQNESFNESEAYECKLLKFPFASFPDRLFGEEAEHRDSNIQCLLHLLKNRLPYLYFIGMDYGEWRIIKNEMVEKLGPESESVTNWDQVWICLEQNRVGMALLHPLVASSVPLGLWPVILANTTSEMSSPTEDNDWDRGSNPLDGLFAVVRGLFMGGHLTKHHGDKQHPMISSKPTDEARLDCLNELTE
jgi:hypothetical protein